MTIPPLFGAVVLAFALGAPALAQAPPAEREPGHIAESVLGKLPGTVSVGVMRDGRVEVAVRRRERIGQAIETVDLVKQPAAEPIFEIGSVSKVFTGLLTAQRVERGELRLDDTIGDLLAGVVSFRYETVSTIQLRQLLTHTSCLKRWPAAFTPNGMFQQSTQYGVAGLWGGLSSHVLGRSPPCETAYSNLGYAVLGQTLAERAQRPWEALVVADIAQPLAMYDTRQHLSPTQRSRVASPWRGGRRSHAWDAGVFAPAGGLHSTATDLLLFSRALMQGGAGPLGPAAHRLVTDLTAFGDTGLRIGYGVLLSHHPERVWFHNGETLAYKAEWVVWPDRKEALVILASNHMAPTRDVRRALVAGTFVGMAQAPEPVYTVGEFRGMYEEKGANRIYVRLKLVPGHKLPFSTLTYRVLNPQLLAGWKNGDQVEFRAERIDGENTLTALRLPAR